MKKPSFIVGLIALSAILVAATLYLVLDNQPTDQLSQQQQAIRAAESFAPQGEECLARETTAVHDSTGAKYTFDTVCLPIGWEVDGGGDAAQPSDKPVSNDDSTSSSPVQSGDKPIDVVPPQSPSQFVRPYDPSERLDLSAEQEVALQQARNYRPQGMCTTVMTLARHIKTGVTYTFNSGCIPEGWERIIGDAM